MSTYADYLLSNDVYNDTEPTVNEKLVSEWNEARAQLAKYRQGGINREVLSQWRAALKARSDALAGAQRLTASLNQAAAQSSQVNARVVADLVQNANDNLTRMNMQSSQVMSTLSQPAIAAFNSGATPQAGLVAGLTRLTGIMTDQGIKPDLANADIAGLATAVTTNMFGGKGLTDITGDQAAAEVLAAGGTQSLADATKQLIVSGQTANNMLVTERASLNAQFARFNQMATAGAPVSADEAMSIANRTLGTVQAMAGGSATDLRTEMERVASMDSTYAQLQKEAAELKELAIQPGQEGLRTKIGRAIANPEFQAWAAENGLKIGESTIDPETGEMRYIPGVHDERAILAFRRQAITGKPLGFSSNTGTRVQVTATDPKMREQILRDYNLGDGRYVLAEDGKTVLSPLEYERSLTESGYTPSGYTAAADDAGNVYVKDALGVDTYAYRDGEFVRLDDADVPAALEFTQAVVQGDDGRQRYMTRADLSAPPASAGQILGADPEDEEQIRAAAPFKFVTADELPAVGEVKIVGYLDKANAKDILKYGEGAFTLNGGQHVFTKGAKIEVLGKRESTFLRDREKLAKERTDEGPALLEPTQVRLTVARQPVEVVPPARELELTAIGEQALADEEFAQARAEMAQRGGVLTPGETVPAGTAAPAPAAPAAPAAAPTAAPAAAPAGAPAAPAAPAAVAPAPTAAAPAAAAPAAAAPAPAAPAPAAAATTYAYRRTSDDAVYRVNTSDGSIEMIKPPPGQVLPPESARKVGKGDSARLSMLAGKLDRGTAVSAAEGQKIEREIAGAQLRQPMAPPEYKVEAGRTGTVISYPEVPKERLELFSALRERIRDARAAREDREAMGAEEPATAAREAAREARAREVGEAPRRAPSPPVGATGMAAARTTALTPAEARRAALRQAEFVRKLPVADEESYAPPTAAEREATRNRALRGAGTAAPAQVTSTIIFPGAEVEAAEAPVTTTTAAATAEKKRGLGVFNKFRNAARPGNGG